MCNKCAWQCYIILWNKLIVMLLFGSKFWPDFGLFSGSLVRLICQAVELYLSHFFGFLSGSLNYVSVRVMSRSCLGQNFGLILVSVVNFHTG